MFNILRKIRLGTKLYKIRRKLVTTMADKMREEIKIVRTCEEEVCGCTNKKV